MITASFIKELTWKPVHFLWRFESLKICFSVFFSLVAWLKICTFQSRYVKFEVLEIVPMLKKKWTIFVSKNRIIIRQCELWNSALVLNSKTLKAIPRFMEISMNLMRVLFCHLISLEMRFNWIIGFNKSNHPKMFNLSPSYQIIKSEWHDYCFFSTVHSETIKSLRKKQCYAKRKYCTKWTKYESFFALPKIFLSNFFIKKS